MAAENGGGWHFEIDLSGLLPCDPIQAAFGAVAVVVGGYAVAEGAVSILSRRGSKEGNSVKIAWP